MNRVIIIGRLTSQPKSTETRNTTMTRFSLAIDRGKDKDGKNLGADFPNCVAFGKRAEVISKYFTKGQQVAIEGHLNTGSYEREDGVKVYTTDVVVDGFDFCGSKKENASNSNANDDIPQGFSLLTSEDIPFD